MENTPSEPIQVSFPLPRGMDTKIHMRLTVQSKAILLFITTVAAEDSDKPAPMGSFVYALPDKYNPNQPLSTTLYSVEATLEFTTRLAKILAKKAKMPVYVGNSISFASTGLGGTMEEEMEAFKQVVAVALDKLQPVIQATNALANGIKNHSNLNSFKSKGKPATFRTLHASHVVRGVQETLLNPNGYPPLRSKEYVSDDEGTSSTSGDRRERDERMSTYTEFEFDESTSTMSAMLERNLVVTIAVTIIFGLFFSISVTVTLLRIIFAAVYLPFVSLMTFLICLITFLTRPGHGYLHTFKREALQFNYELFDSPSLRESMFRLDEAWNEILKILLDNLSGLLNHLLLGFRFAPPGHVDSTDHIVSAGSVVPPGYIGYLERIIQRKGKETKDKETEDKETEDKETEDKETKDERVEE
ncbi:hypothetical protein E0Z10_g9231 [Xylaria hypoxylon]|uniref:Uncharacterized protein n=1 Tax=Xylaria hypoxylon TaxID=37992 RepID=A0A4Z0YSU8_9PEZI|nr:hypothetical protein E0Z10_g9231 [Xylaria hypoxylon]